jgi:Na+-translocating ferredoxin:NAD+ oxidoreductase RnfD subunit
MLQKRVDYLATVPQSEIDRIRSELEKSPKTARIMQSVLLTLPLLVVGWYYYGEAAIRASLLAILFCFVFLFAGQVFLLLFNREKMSAANVEFHQTRSAVILFRHLPWVESFDGGSPICIGLWLSLMLPANIDPRVLAAGCAFAMLAVVLPFGGATRSPFSPTCAAFAFLTICWSSVFAYPISAQAQPLYSTSMAAMLQNGQSVLTGGQISTILIGQTVGPMGAGAILVVAIILVSSLLLKKQREHSLASVGMLATVALLSFIFPHTATGRFSAAGMELFSGTLFFTAVFLLPGFVHLPKRWYFKLAYGALTGAIAVLMRRVSRYEESVAFAVLLANAAWPLGREIYIQLLRHRRQTEVVDVGGETA